MSKTSLKLESYLETGRVYRREMLLPYSKALDRQLKRQEKEGVLEKVGAGLYYCPQRSRFGILPPNDEVLVRTFLKDDPFLLFSWNDYNALGLGLTQIYNKLIVYNRKRHELIKLGNKLFDFRRPPRGFPSELTKEYLLVDLVNNLCSLAEDPEEVKKQIKLKIHHFDCHKVQENSFLYGKVATRKFFQHLEFSYNVFTPTS